jgi:glutamyl-tRNA reductase
MTYNEMSLGLVRRLIFNVCEGRTGMHFLLIGVSHETAPIEVRERFALHERQLPEALERLKKMRSVLECVIVSTCNRTEFYAVVDKPERGRDYVIRFIQSWFHVSEGLLARHSYRFVDEEVVRHLFRVTCGLDSLVLGETQILGQVRDCFLQAQETGATGVLFNTLFKQAVTVAKRAHAETGIADNPVSVGYAAVELARQMFGQFNNKHIVIIGAGKMADLTVKHLQSHGAARFSIVNRTLEHARQLAQVCRGTAHEFEQLPELLVAADIVISSTGADHYVLLRDQVERAMRLRPNRMLFMIDIAMPRDLDPQIHQVKQVFLYDLDDLRGIVATNMAQRQKAVASIEQLLKEQQAAFSRWLQTLGVSPLIEALQRKAAAIHGETMDSLRRKLPDLTERELRVVHKLSKSMLNQMMRDPILKLKELSVQANGENVRELFVQLFALYGDGAEASADERRAAQTAGGDGSDVVLRPKLDV